MTTEIPTVWLWVSGLFFLVNLVFFAALTFGVFELMKFMKEMRPKVDTLTSEVQGLVKKVHSVADRVEEVAISVKETVDTVGGRARNVAGTTDLVVQTAGRQFEKYSPLVVGALTAMRLVKGISEMRASRKYKEEEAERKRSSGGGGLFTILSHLLRR